MPWAVVSYDVETGDCVLDREAIPGELGGIDDKSKTLGFEGKKRALFVIHRRREARLRKAKIEEALKWHNGRLPCEVPGCGFDFVDRYGEVGRGFAHVHHKKPLNLAPDEGRNVSLEELAVVCPNCHVMIHIGGECRAIETLIPNVSLPTSPTFSTGAGRRRISIGRCPITPRAIGCRSGSGPCSCTGRGNGGRAGSPVSSMSNWNSTASGRLVCPIRAKGPAGATASPGKPAIGRNRTCASRGRRLACRARAMAPPMRKVSKRSRMERLLAAGRFPSVRQALAPGRQLEQRPSRNTLFPSRI